MSPELHTVEVISEASGSGWNQDLSRVRVDGGWLYAMQVNSMHGVSAALSFVPDLLP